MKLMHQAQRYLHHYWPENVFLPSAEWYSLVKEPEEVAAVGELSIRGFTRSVYKFDPTLQDSLMSTQLKGDLPCDLLKRLPEWTVYIDIDDGVYVSLDYIPTGTPVKTRRDTCSSV